MVRQVTLAALCAIAALGKPAVMRVERGYAFVEAKVNGAGPFRMLVDTGADSCALTPKAARAAGVRVSGRVTVGTVAGQATVVVSAENTLEIGGVTRGKVEFEVSPLEGVRQVDGRVEGVIGQSFLRQMPYLMDYRGKVLWMGDEAIARSSGLGRVLRADAKAAETVVPVAIGKERTVRRLMLDSGASDLILACETGCPKLSQAEPFDVKTNQGTAHMLRGTRGSLEVGGVVFKGKTAALRSSAGSEVDGLLPTSWFAAVYVDSGNNVVRFRVR